MSTAETEYERPSQPQNEQAELPSVPVKQMDAAERMRFALKVAKRVGERDRDLLSRLAR